MNNEFDAFSAGIEPGGLRNSTQIKILINFITIRIGEPVKDTLIIEALQLHGLANYFEITQAIDELIESGNLISSNGELTVTPKGIIAADELADELPVTVKETALADLINLKMLEKREGENTVEIEKCKNGYNVTFKISHKGSQLMELTVYAADAEQARQLKRNFLKDPAHVYSTVITSLYI